MAPRPAAKARARELRQRYHRRRRIVARRTSLIFARARMIRRRHIGEPSPCGPPRTELSFHPRCLQPVIEDDRALQATRDFFSSALPSSEITWAPETFRDTESKLSPAPACIISEPPYARPNYARYGPHRSLKAMTFDQIIANRIFRVTQDNVAVGRY